ncbi:MAG: hypothetical protein Q9217_000089 [Psora testacea]
MPASNGLLSLAPGRSAIRHLSAATATSNDLGDGPMVVVPPEQLHRPSDAHETAVGIEMAKYRLAKLSSTDGITTPGTPPETTVSDSYAFAFDIDGVLIRGGKPIPEAIEAMKVLNGQNEFGIKIPYIFVTNGGGKTEKERCIDLSRQLEMEISPGQFICGHTPMKEMATKYKTVLVVGGEGEKCRHVAEGYGFRDVVTPGDIIKDNKHTTPFRKLTDEETTNSRVRNFGEQEINAIFVFADSREWAGDQQIILDLLMSKHGRLGTRSETSDEGPPIYFSHNDIVWSTSHDLTRLGMGALHTHGINKPPETVYFVGDTPESDIRGTNEYNDSAVSENIWYSILVRTGVFREGTKPTFMPKATVDNVLEAVKHGIHREMVKAERKKALDHAMKSAIEGVEEVGK